MTSISLVSAESGIDTSTSTLAGIHCLRSRKLGLEDHIRRMNDDIKACRQRLAEYESSVGETKRAVAEINNALASLESEEANR